MGVNLRLVIWRATKSIAFLGLLSAMLLGAQALLTPTPGTVAPWAAVAATEGEVDVLVFGSSRAYCTVLPMEMWRSRGITALDIASGDLSVPASIAFLDQSLRTHNPRVVMLEVHTVGRRVEFGISEAHGAFDYMPPGIPRTRAILQTVAPNEWFELLFPLQVFHSRWNGLGQFDYLADKRAKYAFARGAAYLPEVTPVSGVAVALGAPERDYLDDLTEVKQFVQYVEQHGARPTLFLAPSMTHQTVNGEPILRRLERDLSEEFPSVEYVDLNDVVDEIGINPSTDYKDDRHLNHRGATKTTRWLASYLHREYDLADHRTDIFADEWNKDLATYDEMFKRSW